MYVRLNQSFEMRIFLNRIWNFTSLLVRDRHLFEQHNHDCLARNNVAQNSTQLLELLMGAHMFAKRRCFFSPKGAKETALRKRDKSVQNRTELKKQQVSTRFYKILLNSASFCMQYFKEHLEVNILLIRILLIA